MNLCKVCYNICLSKDSICIKFISNITKLYQIRLGLYFVLSKGRGYGDGRYLIGLRGLIPIRLTKIKTKQSHEKFHCFPVVFPEGIFPLNIITLPIRGPKGGGGV